MSTIGEVISVACGVVVIVSSTLLHGPDAASDKATESIVKVPAPGVLFIVIVTLPDVSLDSSVKLLLELLAVISISSFI